MLYGCELAPDIQKLLEEAVKVQFALLGWAVTAETLTPEACEAEMETRFPERGKGIANFVKTDSRWKLLCAFAGGALAEKRDWVELLRRDVCSLADGRCDQNWTRVELVQVEKDGVMRKDTTHWRNNGAEFLVCFYDALSKSSLAAAVVGRTGRQSFDRYEFAEHFLAANQGMVVCPVCDDSGFHTGAKGMVRTSIDHYFPKSDYPQFAIHAYNLIPVCPLCNSAIKGTTDPLAAGGKARKLQDVLLPYRHPTFAKQVMLSVQLQPNGEPLFEAIRSREGHSELDVQADALDKTYLILERWSSAETNRKHLIGDQLFRRMRHFLALGDFAAGVEGPDALEKQLELLLGAFHEEDMGRDPLTFPMMWWLARLIDEELAETSSLYQEIQGWYEEGRGNAEALWLKGNLLRKLRPAQQEDANVDN